MITGPLRASARHARRLYVKTMFQIMGQALQAISETDPQVRAEASALPRGFLFEMKVIPAGPALRVEHVGEGRLRYRRVTDRKPDLSIRFKHMAHAFLVLSFQEKTAQAFANDRMLVDGDIGYAVRMTRILNRLEAFILPRAIARRAVKEYPAGLGLPEKLTGAARIYRRVATQFLRRAQAT